MCIAIVKTKGSVITDEELTNCFENNPDGAGLAYTKDNEIRYIKGLFDVKSFITTVREAENEAEGAILIHCRIGTSGLKDVNNCHPHVVNEKTVMIHNGILDVDVPNDSKVSDTVIFIENYLKNLDKDFIKDKAIMNLISMAIGNHNKLCFINTDGEYAIVNEKKGEWNKGIWFSNDSYKRTKYRNTITIPYNNYDWEDEYENAGIILTEKEYKYIAKYIKCLDEESLMEIGEFPIYDFWTRELKFAMEYDGSAEAYLMDLDNRLQEMYEEKYYSVLEKYESEVA